MMFWVLLYKNLWKSPTSYTRFTMLNQSSSMYQTQLIQMVVMVLDVGRDKNIKHYKYKNSA